MQWRLLLFAGLALFGALPQAQAQVQVYLESKRTSYLLYEPVQLRVLIRNNTPNTILLSNENGPWLSFLCLGRRGLPVNPAELPAFPEEELAPSQVKSVVVNVTPMFAIRDVGDYRVRAMLKLPDGSRITSGDMQVNVDAGRQEWSLARPVGDQLLTYSLISFSPVGLKSYLYLRVEDIENNLVYTCRALGEYTRTMEPFVQFDLQDQVHILHVVGVNSYGYSVATPQGKVLEQQEYSIANGIGPRFAKTEGGNVVIVGGQRQLVASNNRERLSEQSIGGPASKPRDPSTVDADALVPTAEPTADGITAVPPSENSGNVESMSSANWANEPGLPAPEDIPVAAAIPVEPQAETPAAPAASTTTGTGTASPSGDSRARWR